MKKFDYEFDDSSLSDELSSDDDLSSDDGEALSSSIEKFDLTEWTETWLEK
jgi:hypothetical protein